MNGLGGISRRGPLRLAFALYKYFPFGGLQRDFLDIAIACHARGATVRVYTLQWQGNVPAGLDVRMLKVAGLTNHHRYASFHRQLCAATRHGATNAADAVDATVGFNKGPGLDVYYAADPCFSERLAQRSHLYAHLPRNRHFAAAERSVFAPDAGVEILVLSGQAQETFKNQYATPQARFHLLPPGIRRDRMAGDDADALRIGLRQEFSLGNDQLLVLMVGSGFITKGLDRALRAVAALPDALRVRTRLVAIGQDEPRRFRKLAHALGIDAQVTILSGRADVPRFLQGADLLIHPAYAENTGAVLLEATVAGLPVLTLDVCGYAHYVGEAGAGCVLPSPFSQAALDRALAEMLVAPERAHWRANGIAFGRHAPIYDMASCAADVILGIAATRRDAQQPLA